jgi:hypothetical protein
MRNLESIGKVERHGTEFGLRVAMPSIKVRNFSFTSISDAI